jgi:hypothetical protein
MQVRIAPAADNATIDLIKRRLEDAGHVVAVGLGPLVTPESMSTGAAPDSPGEATTAVIAVVQGDADPADVVRLWTELTEAGRHGLLVLAATTSEAGLPAAVSALPHSGEWIRIQPAAADGCADLLSAVAIASRDPAAGPRAGIPAQERVRKKVRTHAERIRRRLPLPEDRPGTAGETKAGRSIFVSYSHEDRITVDDIYGRLAKEGNHVWCDSKSIPIGTHWREEIEQAICDADLVLVLLSHNVFRKPHYPQIEVDLADTHEKQIIPIFLEGISPLPKGFGFLSGLESVDLHHNFEAGIRQLLALLGQDPGRRSRGARGRAREALAEARSAARRNELGKKAVNAGILGLGVAAAVMGGQVKSMRDQRRREAAEASEQQAERERAYRDTTINLLRRVLHEITLAQKMTPQEYRLEFQPKMMLALGQLRATQPPGPDLAAAHGKVLAALEEVQGELDDVISRLEQEDETAAERAMQRLSLSWVTSLQSSIDGLLKLTSASEQTPGGPAKS